MKLTKRQYQKMIKESGGGFYWDENGTIQGLPYSDLKFYTAKGDLSKRHVEAVLELEDGMTLKGKVHCHREKDKPDLLELTGDFEKYAPILHEIHTFCEIIDNKYAIVELNDEQKKALEELKTLAKKQTK